MTAYRTIIPAVVALLLVGGCEVAGDDPYAAFQDEDPAVRISAIIRAGRTKDPASMPYLVDRLTDSQEDVRFFAILALRKITGQTMGWNYYDPPAARARAAMEWRRWLVSRRVESAGPAGQSREAKEAR